MRTIYILWLRQVKKYLRSPSRVIGSLGQPILYLVALGYGLGSIYAKAGGGNYIQFLTPGVIGMSVLFTSIFSGIEIIWDKQFGFLKETMVAPVSRFNIMLGRTLGGATVASLQGIVVLILSVVVGFRLTNFSLLIPAFVFMFLTALLFTALGTAIAARLNDMQGFQLIMNFLVMPIFFLSGALFPLSGLPKIIEYLTRINPLSYGIDGLRGTLIHAATFNLWTDFGILAVLSILFIAVGAYLFSTIEA
ncbi:MAG TPA: ABC transporter permease [Candidatus Paceibacterota bacterium]|nr:ABC transporter permease [Candidatus Paceibacterota bacterium]